MSRALHRGAVAACLVLAAAAAPLRAQPPGDGPPPPRAASAARDTTHFLPPWLRAWAEFGGGWMSGPSYLKSHYESGQGFAAGLEARPNPRWAVRTALDYQMLLANDLTALYMTVTDPLDPTFSTVDTFHVASQTTGWVLGERTEVGARLFGDLWLTAGGGGGYMRSGLTGVQTDMNTGYRVVGSGAVKNGWGWLWTAGLRYDFMPAPRVPLGLDVRTTTLDRGTDQVRTWSVRVCFRMPEDLPAGAARPPRRF